MKLILMSQRSYVYDKDYIENRDCLDQRWMPFLSACNLLPIIAPNNFETVQSYLKKFTFDGFLLTGGNDTPERIAVENHLIEYAIENNLPLLGICHGMQVIQRYFGITLVDYPGKNHRKEDVLLHGNLTTVNSYHTIASQDTAPELTVWAKTADNWVKAISHTQHNIHGMMWHPERDFPYIERDINFIKKVFKC